MSFIYVADGIDDVLAAHLNQYADAWSGVAGKGQPFNAVAVNDPINFAISARNLDPTNSRVAQFLKADGTVLFQVDASGVKVSPDGTLAGVPVTLTATQTLTNKTFTNPIITAPTGDVLSRLGQIGPLGTAAAQMDVVSIPATFRHLLVAWQARSTTAATNTPLRARLNASSAAAYYGQRLNGVGATVAAGEDITGPPTSGRIGNIAAATAAVALSGSGLTFIPNYAQTAYGKQVLSLSFFLTAVTTGSLNLLYDAFYWDSTAAVNEVTLIPTAGNLDVGSTMTVYGLP